MIRFFSPLRRHRSRVSRTSSTGCELRESAPDLGPPAQLCPHTSGCHLVFIAPCVAKPTGMNCPVWNPSPQGALLKMKKTLIIPQDQRREEGTSALKPSMFLTGVILDCLVGADAGGAKGERGRLSDRFASPLLHSTQISINYLF